MSTIFDYINAQEIAAYITKKTTNAIPIFGQTLFPKKKQLGTDISWIKGADGLPVAITPSNYDAKATLRERTGFGKMETEMAFFREATRIGEKDRQEINKLLGHPNSNIALPIIRNIFDDVARLVEGADIQAEFMRMKLLQYGSFEVSNRDNTAKYKYDYNMNTSHRITATNYWTDATTSNPVKDIIAACDLIEEETGIRPTRAIMNRKTFLDMVSSESIKKDMMIGVAGTFSDMFMSDDEARTYIEKKTGIKIFIYAKKIGVLDATTLTPDVTPANMVNLIDDDLVVLLPGTSLGNTWFGTTPEESDLLSGASDAQVSIVNGGVAVTSFKERHPVNVVTVVSAVMAPSFEQINNIAVIKTSATAQ